MANNSSSNDVKNLWQSQPPEGVRMSIGEIRRKAGKYQRKVFWRNAREYAGALVAVILLALPLRQNHDPLTWLAVGLITAGMAYLVWHLHRRGSARTVPAEMAFANCLEFHRKELARQRDLVGSVWSWYLGPLIPGWVVLTVALARTNPGHLPHIGRHLALLNAGAAIIFILVWKLNARAVRRLQQRIDELDRAEEKR